jgi:hypothetical protein
MLHQIRVRLADRPGSLGRVTWVLGALGVDIRQVVVLGRESGRAVDEFTVELPGGVSRERLVDTLEDVPGVVVQGVWRTSTVPGTASDVAMLGQIAAAPARGLAILVDAAPRLFGADWAALLSSDGAVVYGSVAAPAQLDVPEPLRARAYESGDLKCAMAPLGQDGVLVLARTEAPGFHVAELDRLIQLVDATAVVLAGRPVTADS